MPKILKNEILLSLLLAIGVLIIYILYFKFFYISNEPCHLISCNFTKESINFSIKPSCCPYTRIQLIKEIISVLLPSFLISYFILQINKRK